MRKPALSAVGREVNATVRRNFDALREFFANLGTDDLHPKYHTHNGAQAEGAVAYASLSGRPAVALLAMTVSNPPTQAEVQAIADKLDELLGAL